MTTTTTIMVRLEDGIVDSAKKSNYNQKNKESTTLDARRATKILLSREA